MIQVQTHLHPVPPPPPPQPAPVVFVLDRDASVREAVEQLAVPAGWRTEVFDCGRKFLECPRPDSPACLVLDVSLPDIDGLELHQRIAAEGEDMPAVFLAAQPDVRTTVRAMKAGAVDFLAKPIHAGALLEAIGEAIERSRQAQHLRAETRELEARYATLTPREREVMALVAAGMLNKVAGAELGISEITVKAHRGRMMQKMKARSLAALVRMAGRLGMGQQPRGAARDG